MAFSLHDSMHLSGPPLPFLHRMCMPLQGFTPVLSCYSDVTYLHILKHHLSKPVFEPHKEDNDSNWSFLPLPQALLTLFIFPSHFSIREVIYQWRVCPQRHITERLVLNMFYYVQLVALYRTGLLFPALGATHIASFLVFTLFHGL